MTLSLKQQAIQSFLTRFSQKIERLSELRSRSFEDEAFTLCLVYIDRLASGHFGGKAGRNREDFWRALKNLSGNPLFGMIHPTRLQELTQRRCPSASSFINAIVGRDPHALLNEDDLAEEIRSSSLLEREKDKLISNLRRASMANIAYDYIRVAEVHGPGSGGLSFDETTYEGKKGVTLDFETFHHVLKQIFTRVADASMDSEQWFGNPNYPEERE